MSTSEAKEIAQRYEIYASPKYIEFLATYLLNSGLSAEKVEQSIESAIKQGTFQTEDNIAFKHLFEINHSKKL